jgi:hypothetical protein
MKIIARNHQFLGVNRAFQAVRERNDRLGKLGVFWHPQGSGKSYSMVFFTRKVHRTLGGQFTFLICTDRDDLDTQIYKTFAGCGLVDNDRDPCRASSGEHLQVLLGLHKSYVFTFIQKFNKDVDPSQPYSDRDDIIVITDEAHRTQYGRLALNLRNALSNASFIGFTGTPLFKDDEITRRVFGDYISTYDFQRAVDDKATVPLYYDTRGEKLGIVETKQEHAKGGIQDLGLDPVYVLFFETSSRVPHTGRSCLNALFVVLGKIFRLDSGAKRAGIGDRRDILADKEFSLPALMAFNRARGAIPKLGGDLLHPHVGRLNEVRISRNDTIVHHNSPSLPLLCQRRGPRGPLSQSLS